jgi:hypothetical protein
MRQCLPKRGTNFAAASRKGLAGISSFSMLTTFHKAVTWESRSACEWVVWSKEHFVAWQARDGMTWPVGQHGDPAIHDATRMQGPVFSRNSEPLLECNMRFMAIWHHCKNTRCCAWESQDCSHKKKYNRLLNVGFDPNSSHTHFREERSSHARVMQFLERIPG